MWLNRFERLVGTNNIENLKNKTVLVLGLGGVGGYAVESLVRCGIGTLILVDYDVIDITNLNRQVIALNSNIGKKKTDAWEKRILDINPNCRVILIDEKISLDNISILFNEKIDFFVDACDTIPVKKALIKECLKRKIPFIVSCGTGNKLDPTKLEIMDIRKTSYDPIAKILRKMVKDEKINAKIPVICSTEKPIIKDKVIASCSFVPSVAGLLATSFVINHLLGDEHEK